MRLFRSVYFVGFIVFAAQASALLTFRCENIFSPIPKLHSTMSKEDLDGRMTEFRGILGLEKVSARNMDNIKQAVENLSETQQEQILKFVNDNYYEVSLRKYERVELKSFKRMMDVVLTWNLHPYAYFKARLEMGQQPLDIYSNWLKEINELTGLPSEFTVHDIMADAKWIQSHLRGEARTNYEANFWNLVVYGSLFNGRAIPYMSDIDAIADYKALDRFVTSLNDQWGFKSMQLDHIAANSADKFSVNSAAEINPVVLLISPEYIEVRVYPPLSKSQAMDARAKPEYLSLVF